MLTVEKLVASLDGGQEGDAWDILIDVKFQLGNLEWLVAHQQLRHDLPAMRESERGCQ